MNQLLTVRVTCLESFRKFMYAQTEENAMWNNEANLIATIKGVHKAGVKADYGSCGHAIIEGKKSVDGRYELDGVVISEAQAEPIVRHRQEHPLMVREIHLSKLYRLHGSRQLIVTGTTDAIEGLQLRDTKFKFSSFTMTEYLDSYQWRMYLDMIGLNIFWYDFFRVTRFETLADCDKARIGQCESLMAVRYPAMETDINSLLTEFMEYIEFKGLAPYLQIDDKKRAKILKGDSQLKSILQ